MRSSNRLKAPKSNQANGGSINQSLDEEKRSQPNDMNGMIQILWAHYHLINVINYKLVII